MSFKEIRAQLRHVSSAVRLVWQAARSWALASTVLLLIQSLLPVFSIYLTRELVNVLVKGMNGSAQPVISPSVLVYGGLLGAALLLGAVLGSLQTYVSTGLSEHTQDYITDLIHAKAVTLDVQFYESPGYYDQLQRASIDAINHPLGVVENLNGLLQGLITLLGIAGLLIAYAWWVPVALILVMLPVFWVTLRSNLAYQEWRMRNTSNQRHLAYYNQVLLRDQAVAEVRLFNLGDYFRQAYRLMRQTMRREKLELGRTQLIWQIGAALLVLVGMGLVLLWIAWRGMQGFFNLGDLALFWQVLNQGQRQLQGLLASAGDIYRSLFFLDDLFVFLSLAPKIEDTPAPAPPPDGLRQKLDISKVTFQYPDSPTPALLNFSLSIPAGQIVAIVGENGAGKSTLIKLLCRFYDPQQGQITWDGVDIRRISVAALRRRITVLFQRPIPYHETAEMNIRLGDLENRPTQAQVEEAALAGGAAGLIEKLPKGYETVLGKWFGYTELSVGEWQRIALARAFVRQADLVILDEPTSAMDSWAENDWMANFRELVKNKTALVITHRFTTAMQADVIHVMADGKIIESGSHAELVALGGHYATSWKEQVRETQQEYAPNDVLPTSKTM